MMTMINQAGKQKKNRKSKSRVKLSSLGLKRNLETIPSESFETSSLCCVKTSDNYYVITDKKQTDSNDSCEKDYNLGNHEVKSIHEKSDQISNEK